MRIKLLHEYAVEPSYAKLGDAGADLYSIEDCIIHARGQRLVRTGIALEIPEGFFGLVRPRSGLATKHGIGINSSGVIDSGYRGELAVTLINHTDKNYRVQVHDRIAQIVFIPIFTPTFEVVDKLSETERGEGGFGSTGGWNI